MQCFFHLLNQMSKSSRRLSTVVQASCEVEYHVLLSLSCPNPQVLSPTYKQRNEDFRKLFKKLPDTERLIVGE